MVPNIHTAREKRIFIGINLEWILVAIIQELISSNGNMVSMLCIRWRTYVKEVELNLVKHGCLLNEPTYIKEI